MNAHPEAILDPNFYFPATHNVTTLPIAENMKPFPVFSPFIVKSYSLELFVISFKTFSLRKCSKNRLTHYIASTARFDGIIKNRHIISLE